VIANWLLDHAVWLVPLVVVSFGVEAGVRLHTYLVSMYSKNEERRKRAEDYYTRTLERRRRK